MDSNKIVMLGTGHAVVEKCYNTCFVLQSKNACLLVDGGGGSQILTQLKKVNLSLKEIDALVVTHTHTDHLLGVIWILRMVSALKKQLIVYGHDEVINALKTICQLTFTTKMYEGLLEVCQFVIVEDGQKESVHDMQLTFFDIHSTKTKQFGFNVQINQLRIACLGDEPYQVCCKPYVENCDLLMCEAFCLFSQKDIFKPYEKHHSTALDAGKLASQLNVKSLLLYHTEDKNLEQRKELYTKEASQYFNGTIYVPDDLETILI